LQPLAQEFRVKCNVPHLVGQNAMANRTHRRIAAPTVQQAEVDLRDQLGDEKHLDIKLHSKMVPQPPEDRIGPLLLEALPPKMVDERGQNPGVELLLGNEERNGLLIPAEVFRRHDLPDVPHEPCAATAFAKLEDRQRIPQVSFDGLG
jgi:hypothetical protein